MTQPTPAIPVSQIFLNDQPDAPLPPALAALTAQIQQYIPPPLGRYQLYNSENLRSFLHRHYNTEVVQAFDTLQPYAYKADLGRYALLLQQGGWYFDIATRLHTPVRFRPEIELVLFREQLLAGNCSWACQNAVLYARPGHLVFQKALERILWNVRHQHYGANTLCPTGPIVLGRALAQVDPDLNRVIVGESIRLTPTHQNKNLAFVLPDGTIFAFHKSAGSGDLTALGASGTNNYVELWQQRRVYA